MRGGTIFDSTRGQMLPNRTVVIRGDRIEQVCTPDDAPAIPPEARVLDVRGKFIIPGLIDAQVRLVHELDGANMTGDKILPLFLAAVVSRDIKS